jgi:putative hydrolase of the HAD superfamily
VRALLAWLWDAFERGIRGDTFDRLRQAFPAVGERLSTGELVDAYRSHSPTIALAPGVEDMLDALRQEGVRLGVVSDGPIASQSAKATALDLDRWFDPIVLTGGLGPGFAKPATGAFEAIARAGRIPHDELAYVADNPEKDFAGPRRLGWLTVRLRDPEQLRFALEPASTSDGPDLEVRALADLLRLDLSGRHPAQRAGPRTDRLDGAGA